MEVAWEADRIGALGIQQILALLNVGDVTLSAACRDLLALLETSLPLAVAHALQHTAA